MTEIEYSQAAEATALCKACGLCCTGHLFAWVRLKASELTPLEKMGLPVIRSDPRQRGFTQPCPMWKGICTIYESHHYPRGCDSYRCKLLRELLDESVVLPKALRVVQKAKDMIRTVDEHLPAAPQISFRERLINHMEQGEADEEFQEKANALLAYLERQFGVNDFFEKPVEA